MNSTSKQPSELIEQDPHHQKGDLAGEYPDLLAAVQNGDSEAFCDLVEPLEAALYRQAIKLCGNESTAKDLAQDTLVTAWKSIRKFNGKCRLRTWMVAIMIRIHWKQLRYEGRRPIVFLGLEFGTYSMSPVQEPSTDTDLAEVVRRHVDRLPLKYREVVCLRFYQDATVAEIAAALKIKPGTVKSRLFYALEHLRKMQLMKELR